MKTSSSSRSFKVTIVNHFERPDILTTDYGLRTKALGFFVAPILIFCFVFLPSRLISQDCMIDQPTSDATAPALGAANREVGQTFLACGDGNITAVCFEIGGVTIAGNTVLTISTGMNTNGGGYTQTVAITGAGVINIPLTTPFPVTNGTQYAISLAEEGFPARFSMRFNNGDILAGTNVFSGNGVDDATLDIVFSVTIQRNPAVPTLGQWGLIVLTLLLAIVGIAGVLDRKRKDVLTSAPN